MNTFTGLSPEEGDNIEINNPKECKRAEKKLKIINEKIEKCECEDRKKYLLNKKRILEILINEYENRDKGIPVKKPKHTETKVKEEFVFDKKEKEEIRNFNVKRKREKEQEAKDKAKARKEREEKFSEYWGKWEDRYNTWNNEEKVRKEKKDEEFYQKYKQQQQEQQEQKEQKEEQEEQGKQNRQQKRRQQRQQQKKEKQQSGKRKEDDNKGPVDLKSFIEDFNMKLKDVPKDIINLNHKFTIEDFKQLSRKYHPDKLSGKQDFMYILNEIRDHYIKRDIKHDETWTK